MAARWQSKLRAGETVLIDGATGTELRRRGIPLDRHAWSGPAALTHFDALAEIHADYLRAGAEILTTNTFGTSRFVLRAAGIERDFTRVNRAAVDAARTACRRTGRRAEIAGAISCLPPGFDVSAYPDPHAEREAYVELAALLADAGVDLLVLEMMEDTVHARRACEAVRSVALPVWLGVSVRRAAGGSASGTLTAYDFPDVPFASILDALLEFEPAVVNVMHSPLDAVGPALRELRLRWSGFTGVYPEIPAAADRETLSGPPAVSPEQLARAAAGWIADGARIVGGCCGATPAHIAAMAEAVAAANRARRRRRHTRL